MEISDAVMEEVGKISNQHTKQRVMYRDLKSRIETKQKEAKEIDEEYNFSKKRPANPFRKKREALEQYDKLLKEEQEIQSEVSGREKSLNFTEFGMQKLLAPYVVVDERYDTILKAQEEFKKFRDYFETNAKKVFLFDSEKDSKVSIVSRIDQMEDELNAYNTNLKNSYSALKRIHGGEAVRTIHEGIRIKGRLSGGNFDEGMDGLKEIIKGIAIGIDAQERVMGHLILDYCIGFIKDYEESKRPKPKVVVIKELTPAEKKKQENCLAGALYARKGLKKYELKEQFYVNGPGYKRIGMGNIDNLFGIKRKKREYKVGAVE